VAKLTEEEKARRALNRRRKAALEAEKDALRCEEKQREWQENGTRLTWDEYVAGVPCRGCGQPINDRRGGWPLPINMDDKQREEHERAEADYRQRHPNCRSHRWMVQGSRTTHCGFCCPPPPLSEKQIKEIGVILGSFRPADPASLATWQLALTCGHTIEKTQHRSHSYWSGSVTDCSDCQQIRGVVTAEKLPSSSADEAAEQSRRADDLSKARAEHVRLQKKADAALRRVGILEQQIADP
jgi:hypothetical protein